LVVSIARRYVQPEPQTLRDEAEELAAAARSLSTLGLALLGGAVWRWAG
jgi:hypothetical protein